MEKLKAAFIFIYPAEGDPSAAPVCQGWTETPGVDLLAIGVASYPFGFTVRRLYLLTLA